MKARIFMLIGLVFIIITTSRVLAQSPGSLFDNVALSTEGATATAISEGEFPSGNFQYAYFANDGDPNTSWSSQWDMPAWLKIEFDQVQNIVVIGIVWASHQHTFSVSLSLDGSTWTTVVPSRLSTSEEGISGVYELFSISSMDAKYIRIDITSTSAPPSHIFQASVGELQAFPIIPISVEDDITGISLEYFLNQNYPNPFNPVTTIKYGLPKKSNITLIIYSLIGREIIRWDEQNIHAGLYEKVWDGRNKYGESVASGIYFYRLRAGDYIETKKMVLLR